MRKKRKTNRTGTKAGRPKTPPGQTRRRRNVQSEPPEAELLNMHQAIKLLKTSRPTFYRWLRSGKIKGMKVGRQWRFHREEIDRFLKGEEPRIELRTDINPLIQRLRTRLEQTGTEARPPHGKDAARHAVDLIFQLALSLRASDIHLAPHTGEWTGGGVAVLRYRVDGVLHVETEFDVRLLPAMVERVKRMASCDIHEKKKPQDGRILYGVPGADRPVDIRVSFLPGTIGESLTARVLEQEAVEIRLERINYSTRDGEVLLRALERRYGMILITGPTGCGKTTVLYACLNQVSGPGTKTVTVEDPVEYLLPWTVQVPVRTREGISFSVAMRAALRSDPDVLLIGEIRDLETLQICHQASLTGHLVLTTLHARDAAMALTRMVNIGSPPFLVADSTRVVLSQRLVRKLCPHCSEEDLYPEGVPDNIAQLARSGGIDLDSLEKNFRKPAGCDKCVGGYRGRTVIAEALEVTPRIRAALVQNAGTERLRAIAVEEGMTTMAADGIRRAASGETSLAEVLAAVGSM